MPLERKAYDESDEALLARYCQGQGQEGMRAFETLLSRHRSGVYNFLRRHAGEHVAEDLLQETFIRVAKNARSFAGEAKFTTWLYTIARNLSVDALRRAKLRQTESIEGSENARPLQLEDASGDTERAVQSKEIGRRVEEALKALPEDLREVFLLRERGGLSFAEVAQVVGCPENTAKSRMRYALTRLRELLSDLAEAAKETG